MVCAVLMGIKAVIIVPIRLYCLNGLANSVNKASAKFYRFLCLSFSKPAAISSTGLDARTSCGTDRGIDSGMQCEGVCGR